MYRLYIEVLQVRLKLVLEAEDAAASRLPGRHVGMGVRPIDVSLAKGNSGPVHGGQGRRHLHDDGSFAGVLLRPCLVTAAESSRSRLL